MIDVYILKWTADELTAHSGDRGALNRAVSAKCGDCLAWLCGAEKISHEPNGRPYIAGKPDVHVSISHCGATCAVSKGDIVHGVDIERVRPLRESVVRRVLDGGELEQYYALDVDAQRQSYFFRQWTRKEALIKCGALSLGSMHTVSADADVLRLGGDTYYFSTIETDGHALSVCVMNDDQAIEYHFD